VLVVVLLIGETPWLQKRNAEAPDAFKRLTEAADELRQQLTQARYVLTTLRTTLGGVATPDMLERPQEALFAEASRTLSAVLVLSGEGEVPEAALLRSVVAFSSSPAYSSCQGPSLLSAWFDGPNLIEFMASTPLRTAYDCSPKRFRAQFLCTLQRATLVEAKRYHECIRPNWQAVLMQFPEIGLWRELRERLKARVWTPDAIEGEPADEREPWDEKMTKPSSWAKKVARPVQRRFTEGHREGCCNY